MVKCCACGFLCVSGNTHELVEVPEDWRESGQIPQHLYDLTPRCFVKAMPLKAEMRPVTKAEDWTQNFLLIINKERACSKFTSWQQGYTPKEHQDMLQEKAILEFQAEQRERERRWQEDQKAQDRVWQQQQKKTDRIWQMVYLLVGASLGWLFSHLLK